MPGPSMDSLPPEILGDIFLQTLPDVLNEYPTPCSESIVSPLRVSHVCQSWRELALSIRELWSYLYIDTENFRGKQELMVKIFDTWLSRTNDGPINFTIGARLLYGATTQDHECAEYMFTTLVENQHRLKEVHLICLDARFSPRFPGFNLTNMPLLTSLNLNLLSPQHSVIDLASSSRLRRLIIGQNDFDMVASSRLSHLERVDLFFRSHERNTSLQGDRFVLSCLELLRNAPSLHRVSITTIIKAPLSPLPWDRERILLAGVREVLITGSFGSHLPAMVVDTVTLPSLEKFTYCSSVGGEELFRFFQRSTPPLTRLDLDILREEKLVDILRLLPDLQHLTLRDEPSYQFCHELTVPDGSSDHTSAADQIVCPALTFLQIGYISWGNSTLLERLLTMAKSRAFILGTFKTVTYYPSLSTTDSCTVTIAFIDNYADDIHLDRSITFAGLCSMESMESPV